MRIVVVDDVESERQTIVRALAHGAWTVDACIELKRAALTLQTEPVQVVVLAWPKAGGAETVRLLRSVEAFAETYVIAIVDSIKSGPDIAAAIAGGAQDLLRRPIADSELIARVQAPARMLAWAKKVQRTGAFDASHYSEIAALRAWTSMGRIVAEDLAQILGEPLKPADGWPKRFEQGLRMATIPMSLASDQTEVRVSIVADDVALASLSGSLLGDPKAERSAQDDLLRELANTAGGAVKRAALPDNVTLTTGIPVSGPGSRPNGTSKSRCWTIPIQKGVASMALVGEIRKRENVRVNASQLREGMVLAHDLRNDAGALLVGAGTRLTSTAAERITHLVGPRFSVEVACAD